MNFIIQWQSYPIGKLREYFPLYSRCLSRLFKPPPRCAKSHPLQKLTWKEENSVYLPVIIIIINIMHYPRGKSIHFEIFQVRLDPARNPRVSRLLHAAVQTNNTCDLYSPRIVLSAWTDRLTGFNSHFKKFINPDSYMIILPSHLRLHLYIWYIWLSDKRHVFWYLA